MRLPGRVRRSAYAGEWTDVPRPRMSAGRPGTGGGAGGDEPTSRAPSTERAALLFLALCGAVALVSSAVGAGVFVLRSVRRAGNLQVSAVTMWSPAVRQLAPAARASERGRHERGLAAGRYSLLKGRACATCADRIRLQCGYTIVGDAAPQELMVAGRLGQRHDLSELSQCFLWYSKVFWMRGTGGATGITHYRRGGMENKNKVARQMAEYDEKHRCLPFQVSPVAVNLSDVDACRLFFANNSWWDALAAVAGSRQNQSSAEREARRAAGVTGSAGDRIWFLKKEDGSRGVGIAVLSGAQVEHAHAQGGAGCPRKGVMASLNVPAPWLYKGRKWDMRVFVLVASLKPLIVWFRPGHLRVSGLRYQPYGGRDGGLGALAMHVICLSVCLSIYLSIYLALWRA